MFVIFDHATRAVASSEGFFDESYAQAAASRENLDAANRRWAAAQGLEARFEVRRVSAEPRSTGF